MAQPIEAGVRDGKKEQLQNELKNVEVNKVKDIPPAARRTLRVAIGRSATSCHWLFLRLPCELSIDEWNVPEFVQRSMAPAGVIDVNRDLPC